MDGAAVALLAVADAASHVDFVPHVLGEAEVGEAVAAVVRRVDADGLVAVERAVLDADVGPVADVRLRAAFLRRDDEHPTRAADGLGRRGALQLVRQHVDVAHGDVVDVAVALYPDDVPAFQHGGTEVGVDGETVDDEVAVGRVERSGIRTLQEGEARARGRVLDSHVRRSHRIAEHGDDAAPLVDDGACCLSYPVVGADGRHGPLSADVVGARREVDGRTEAACRVVVSSRERRLDVRRVVGDSSHVACAP